MEENLHNYKDLTNLMTAAPQVPTPANFTQRVMANLDAAQKLSAWQTMRQTFAEAGKISWSHFADEGAQGQNTFFYFLCIFRRQRASRGKLPGLAAFISGFP